MLSSKYKVFNAIMSYTLPYVLPSHEFSAVWFHVQGILDAYHYTLGQVEFYGPTNFSNILDKAMEYAQHPTQDAQRYQILLIITVSR